MAPSVIDSFNALSMPNLNGKNSPKWSLSEGKNKHGYIPGVTVVNNAPDDVYEHDQFRPSFPLHSWAALEEVPYEDKGLLGDPEFRNLLDAAEDVFDYSPKIGTEIVGVKLNSLTDAQKNDLARLIATRGVVFFRNQADFTVQDQLNLGRYFGSLHKHATTALPKKEGLDEIHVVYTDGNSKDQSALFDPSYLWHSDVSGFLPFRLWYLAKPLKSRSLMKSNRLHTPLLNFLPDLLEVVEVIRFGLLNTPHMMLYQHLCKSTWRA